jgi:hypothetical protein
MIDISLDIETIRDLTDSIEMRLIDKIEPDARLKDPDKIKASINEKAEAIKAKCALQPLTGKIICVCCLDVDGAHGGFESCGPDEHRLLEELTTWLAGFDGAVRLITFNGRKFDIPYIATRAALLEVYSDFHWPIGYSAHHFDLRDVLQDGPLDFWADRFLSAPKDFEGSEVQGLWDVGKADLILKHCRDDVAITAALWRRIRAVVDVRSK